MAVTSLQAESARANPTQTETLYRAWRYAKAQWDLADYSPECPEGLSDQDRDAYCDAEQSALMAFFLEPAATPQDLALKLSVFRAEEAWGLTAAPKIAERIHRDSHRFAFGFDPS